MFRQRLKEESLAGLSSGPATVLRGRGREPARLGGGERRFHYGTRLPAAKASHANIIRREQTFPQVRENSQGPGSAPSSLPSLPPPSFIEHLLGTRPGAILEAALLLRVLPLIKCAVE